MRIASLTVLLALTACSSDASSSYAPPSRDDPSVMEEEARLASLLAAPGLIVHSGGHCAVRLLGTDDDTSFAFVSCAGDNGEGAGVPVRVEGDLVLTPEDGGGYDDDVRAMFPDDIAELILERSPLTRP